MLFNSFNFLLFFPIVTVIYFLLPHKARWVWLLGASSFFYMCFVPKYILILAATILVDYFAAIGIYRTTGTVRKQLLWVSIAATCFILFFFKYFNFFAINVTRLAAAIGWNYNIELLKWVLPIGLSFHTFQSLSYVIEVYRGNQKPETHFGIYSLFVIFYPQLVAGPIERPQNLLHQFHEKHEFDYSRIKSGLILMGWGLFKKVVIADRLAQFVNSIFVEPTKMPNDFLIAGVFFFTFQVFCDFSGYSDIARGTARVMGFELMVNFNRPYWATSLSDFWQRWHISLSTWLRDYVYDPLAIGMRYWGRLGICIALITTFFVSGLWHGASCNFIIWGLLHGAGLSLESLVAKKRKKISKKVPAFLFVPINWLITFLFVSFSYIYFRASTLSDANYIAKQVISNFNLNFLSLILDAMISFDHHRLMFGQKHAQIQIFAYALLAMELGEYIAANPKAWSLANRSPVVVRWSFYYVLTLSTLIFGVWFSKREFIYFQF